MKLRKGQNIFVRTVTHYHTGQIVKMTKSWLYLKDAAWIADMGRFNETIREGTTALKEVEPGETCVVARGAIVDIWPWPGKLPRDVK